MNTFWAVSCLTDVPVRIRAAFDDLADATEFCQRRFGKDGWIMPATADHIALPTTWDIDREAKILAELQEDCEHYKSEAEDASDLRDEIASLKEELDAACNLLKDAAQDAEQLGKAMRERTPLKRAY